MNKKSLLELRKLSIEELAKYYKEQRKEAIEEGIPLSEKSIRIRNKIHQLLLKIVIIDRLFNHETVTVLKDERVKNNHPKVFACTHIGGNDIQRTFEAIKDPAYLFLGDPQELYRNLEGLLLYLNGVICLETRDKIDRGIAKKRSIELLEKGGNLLIYPEGAWNISPNLPVMKLYKGAVNIAVKTKADLIPIAIEQVENHFYVSIGKNIITSDMENIDTNLLNQTLRDAMATEKWHIWESVGVYSRDIVKDQTVDNYQQSIVKKCSYNFTLEDVLETMYKDPNEISHDEVFAPIKKLHLHKNSLNSK